MKPGGVPPQSVRRSAARNARDADYIAFLAESFSQLVQHTHWKHSAVREARLLPEPHGAMLRASCWF